MACFLVPAAEAVVTTVAAKAVKKHESKVSHKVNEVKLSEKLSWLNNMLWGGSALLAFEHLWHGEISPFFPFLTAASDPAATTAMLHEMATSGVAMSVVVTLAWAGISAAISALQKRPDGEEVSEGAAS